MTRLAFLTASLLLAVSSGAQAQDITGIVTLTGLGQYETGTFEGIGDTINAEINGLVGAISAKVGVVVSDDVTVQFDGWVRPSQAQASYSDGLVVTDMEYADLMLGGAAHVTYRTGDFFAGVVGGLGHWVDLHDSDFDGNFATIGVEGGYEGGEFRLAGQLGLTTTIGEGEFTTFGNVSAAYYLNPDLSVSATVSVASLSYENGPDDFVNIVAHAGAEVRYKLENSPLILSAGYTFGASYMTSSSPDMAMNQTRHRVTAGISIPFGTGPISLRDLDRAVGLTLDDPRYGIAR